jgi:UDP-glucose 4-epimerase
MSACLITGGAGFFGSILKQRLLDRGQDCVSIDFEKDELIHPNLKSVQGDIRDRALMERLFAEYRFHTIYHCGAVLAHAMASRKYLWSCNVDGTQVVADMAEKFGAQQVVFISSNCLWAQNFGRPVTEDDIPSPVEIYGLSKWEGERILQAKDGHFNSTIIRCPTIMDEGRLGLLSILFEFIHEGRKVWVVGGGHNVYQFIYAPDLASACIAGSDRRVRGVFNIGSDNVRPFRDVYQYVIDRAATGARLASLPRTTTLMAMRLAHWLRVSPLGPYQYRMIAEDFVFDTTRIKSCLDWQPTLTNEEMLWKSYKYYHDNRRAIAARKNVSAHRQAAKMGAIRLLKWVS